LPPKTRFPEYGSVLLIGQFEERNAELESVAVSGEHPCVTTLITAAKETTSLEDETTVLWRYVERFSSLRGSPPPPHPKKDIFTLGRTYIRTENIDIVALTLCDLMSQLTPHHITRAFHNI